MSIIRSLLRLVDPIEHRRQTAEERRKREVLPPDVNPDQVELEVEPARPRDQPPLLCRVCAHVGDGPYCPHCLAETMERET
jgi:hypothetical protein